MKDATRRRTDMHAAVLLFLFSLRELHPELEHQCLHGSCFRLHQLLTLVFPGATALCLLKELVAALDKTYWSSWQSTAQFDDQLNHARSFLAKQEENHD